MALRPVYTCLEAQPDMLARPSLHLHLCKPLHMNFEACVTSLHICVFVSVCAFVLPCTCVYTDIHVNVWNIASLVVSCVCMCASTVST